MTRLGVLLLLLGATMAAFAVQGGGWWWWLLWPASNLGFVAGVYFARAPQVFGKDGEGRISRAVFLLLVPFFLSTWAIWWLIVRCSRERAYDELVPGVLIGRRPVGSECLEEVTDVYDLTCEFNIPSAFSQKAYHPFPILDGGAPSLEVLTRIVGEIRGGGGVAFVHCAQGHGRTGLVAVALLLAEGRAPDVRAAVAYARERRQGVRLNRDQRVLARAYAKSLES